MSNVDYNVECRMWNVELGYAEGVTAHLTRLSRP